MTDQDTLRMLEDLRGRLAAIQVQLAENEKRAGESLERICRAISELRLDARETALRTDALEEHVAEEARPG